MEPKTNIQKMMQGNIISVPSYQRAYSWDKDKQVKVFLDDINDYVSSGTSSSYYLGHFLYRQIDDKHFDIVDGQQRLTTITIFLNVLKRKMLKLDTLSEEEVEVFEDILKRGAKYRFRTVDYDNQYLIDYVYGEMKGVSTETNSQKRIYDAYNYFDDKLKDIDNIDVLRKMLHAVSEARCSTFIVDSESEAIQMFIFQNNRGKKVSNLENIKAQFMYNINLYGDEERENLIEEVQNRFEKIYKSISNIEDFVDEDDVLSNTLKVYYNSLWENDSIKKTNEELLKPKTRIQFIQDFCNELSSSFDQIVKLKRDKEYYVDIECALLCDKYDIVLPFFIKAYKKDLPIEDIKKLGRVLGDLMLRDAFVQTKADMRSRLNDVFLKFDIDVKPIIDHIQWMKGVDIYWWGFWNNKNFQNALESQLRPYRHKISKIALWNYENYLRGLINKGGYDMLHFGQIQNPQLEHIYPQAEGGEPIANGYDQYSSTEERDEFLYSIGNFLLLSGSHNESIGNKDFSEKRLTYNSLEQQREIQRMTTDDNPFWGKEQIEQRRKKMVNILVDNF